MNAGTLNHAAPFIATGLGTLICTKLFFGTSSFRKSTTQDVELLRKENDEMKDTIASQKEALVKATGDVKQLHRKVDSHHATHEKAHQTAMRQLDVLKKAQADAATAAEADRSRVGALESRYSSLDTKHDTLAKALHAAEETMRSEHKSVVGSIADAEKRFSENEQKTAAAMKSLRDQLSKFSTVAEPQTAADNVKFVKTSATKRN